MKLLIAVLSLWAVAVFALRGDKRYRFDEVDEREVEAFRAGKTFRYRLDTQISSGMASVSEQHAVTRLQAEAQLHFQTERLVTLRLKNPVLGTLNREISEPERVQPMEMFTEASMKSEETRLLELPCTFDYVDGLVERIRFHQEDKPWSKNVKKAALNMLQLNLKQRQGDKVELKQLPEWEEERKTETTLSKNEQESKTFVMPEITLEGECQVSYTLNKLDRRNKFASYYDNEMSGRDEPKMFNVTKSIDFHRCNKIADIRYGPKIELPCDNCTDIQELEERKLDRTTVIRHIVVGNSEQYGIKKAQVVSHYMFKMLSVEEETPMHTIVACELNYIRFEESRRSELEGDLRSVQTGQKEETLLYSTEWDEAAKRFYMYGDEEFPIKTSPFEKLQNKVSTVDNLMKKLTGMWADKTNGIESEATIIYSRIVEVLRMCNIEEVQEIFRKYKDNTGSRLSESDQIKAEDIIIDALANAGVHNTIKVLVEKILQREIQPVRAVRALVQLKDLPAPSEKIVEMVTRLCETEVCYRHEPCKQVCWLTIGAIMGDLCDEELTVDDVLEQKKPTCHLQLRKDFVKKIMEKYNKEETRYGKIVLLKSLGNAGLDTSVFELEKIIRDIREEPMIRMQAIDSLRRLRAVMPHKIQRVLMPVYQNIRERPEVRMTALSLLLSTIPEHATIDQIGYTLMRDPCRQVKSYVYTTMKQLSTSPVEEEQKLARHLQALLKLADITEEDEETLLRGSRHYRIPVYSKVKREGFFVDMKSMFGSDDMLPKHLGVNIQTVFNGLFQMNTMEVSLTQEDLEQWVEKMMDVYMDQYYGESSYFKKSSLRGNRKSRNDRDRDTTEYDNDFRKIKSLDIKKRTRSNRIDSDSNTNTSPFGMICLRYGDVDYAVLPLEEELLPHCLKKIFIDGERPSMRDFENLGEYMQGRPFRAQAAMHLLENSVKIPTSAGFPIRMWHVIPVLASVEGSIKPRFGSEVSAEVKLHPSVTITHLKRIEVWTPIMNTGVESTRTVATNLPISGKLEIRLDSESKKTFQWRMNVPEANFRLLSLHTLPLTFVSEKDYTKTVTPVVKRIENTQLLQRAQHIEKTIGKENFGMTLKVHGEIHMPHTYSYEEIIRTLMASENHLRVEFIANQEQPREIVLSGEGRFYQASKDESRRQHRELKGFYGKSNFNDEMDRYYEDESEDDERQLSKFLDDYEPRKMYNHRVMLKIETIGGQKDKKAQMELEADCDAEHRFFKAILKVNRSPLPMLKERKEWTMTTEVQTLLPETISNVEKYDDKRRSTNKNEKFVCQINSEWGTDRKNTIRVNINGEQARNQMWREKINEVDRTGRTEQPKLRDQMMRKVAFLNKYDISAEARVEPETKNFFNQLASYLKAWNFWSTSVEMKTGRDNQIQATVVIDPMTHEHANITIKTPVEIIRIDSLRMPMKIKPFKLIKTGQSPRSIESFTELVSSYGYESRSECKVDSRKVRSFDDVIFKAPLTKCYSVLAKDCSNTERPRFVVMMKKVSEQKKELKMLSNGDTIEIKPKGEKLIVKINGREEQDYETLRNYGVDNSEDMVRINTRDISVRFDGEIAWVKISQSYKGEQCGLCGHYDDNAEDEWRMSNNENTRDLKSFHKSYSLVEDECRNDLEETHRREEYKPIEDSFEKYERDSEYQLRRQRTNENDETEPIEKTEVMEYNHKVCFSIKPVKTCPEGSYPKETKNMKIGFSCLDRSSTEARRLLREARRQDRPLELPRDNKPSFVETLTVPVTCSVY